MPSDNTLSWLSNATFELWDHGLACYPPNTSIGPRVIHSWQLMWLASGTGTWEIHDQIHPLHEDAVWLVRPGVRHVLRWDASRRIRHGWVAFHLHPARRYPIPDDLAMIRQVSTNDVLLPILRHLRSILIAHPPGWAVMAEGALRQALFIIASGQTMTEREDADDTVPVVENALVWLSKRWQDGSLRPPRLTTWARAVGSSREHLIRSFRRSYGVTPMEAVRLLRLDRAAQLLAAGNQSVQDVALATGFANPFHFARCFAVIYGCAPSAYHNRISAGLSHYHVALVKVRTMASHVWNTR